MFDFVCLEVKDAASSGGNPPTCMTCQARWWGNEPDEFKYFTLSCQHVHPIWWIGSYPFLFESMSSAVFCSHGWHCFDKKNSTRKMWTKVVSVRLEGTVLVEVAWWKKHVLLELEAAIQMSLCHLESSHGSRVGYFSFRLRSQGTYLFWSASKCLLKPLIKYFQYTSSLVNY